VLSVTGVTYDSTTDDWVQSIHASTSQLQVECNNIVLNNNMSRKSSTSDSKKIKSQKNKTKAKKKLPRLQRAAAIVFDGAARVEHLQGFSQRKQARRQYGHAQQKVKDRQQKLERRAAIRAAEREQIEQAEAVKGPLLEVNPRKRGDEEVTQQVLFDGVETEQQWGGHVVVVTSTHIPGDSDDEEGTSDKPVHKNTDTEQLYAGNIQKYLKVASGKVSSSKQSKPQKRRGQHGATHMKGVKNAGDLKVAQKMLQRSTQKKAAAPQRKGGQR
jgi:ribosomal RNA-processing protein 17